MRRRRALGLPSATFEFALHNKIAYPMMGIPAALLAAALALRRGRTGHLTTALMEGVAVVAVLWGQSVIFKSAANNGHLAPHWAAWTPVVVLSVMPRPGRRERCRRRCAWSSGGDSRLDCRSISRCGAGEQRMAKSQTPCPVVHFEINGKDNKKAKAFYSKLFNWKIHLIPQMGYGMIDADGEKKSQINGGMSENTKSFVTVYVLVPDPRRHPEAGQEARLEGHDAAPGHAGDGHRHRDDPRAGQQPHRDHAEPVAGLPVHAERSRGTRRFETSSRLRSA